MIAAELIRAADCQKDYVLSDWLDGDERELIVYITITPPQSRHFLPVFDVIGADAEGQIFDRAGLCALIGAEYVAKMEE